jgi:hypothetical protein
MAVRIDEAGDQDAVACLDYDGVSGRDIGFHLMDLAVLDQDIGVSEVADGPVARQHDPTFDEDAAGALQAGKLIALSERRCWRDGSSGNGGGRFENAAA